MTIIRTLILAAASIAAAHAQNNWAQPVREVEKEASSAITGSCTMSWYNSEGGRTCQAYTVPAGKRLAIRHVSARCYGRSGDGFSMINLRTYDPGSGAPYESYTTLSATLASVAQFPVERVGSSQVFQHAQTGTTVDFYATFSGNPTVTHSPTCAVRFSGFLVSQ